MRFLFVLLLAGCGGGTAAYSQAPTPDTSVLPAAAVYITVKAVSPFVAAAWENTVVVQAGLTQQFAATALGGAAISGVTWSVLPCGEPNCGTIDASGKYTAPTTPPGFGADWWTNMTIMATSVT